MFDNEIKQNIKMKFLVKLNLLIISQSFLETLLKAKSDILILKDE